MAAKSAGFVNPKADKIPQVKFPPESIDFGDKKLVLSYNKAVERFDLRKGGELVISSCRLAEVRKRFEELKKIAPPPPPPELPKEEAAKEEAVPEAVQEAPKEEPVKAPEAVQEAPKEEPAKEAETK